MSLCFFFNDTSTTEIYTLSLHDALPICFDRVRSFAASASNRLRAVTQSLSRPLAIKPAEIAGHVAKTSEYRGATGRLGIADEGDRAGVAKNLPEALRAGDCGGGAGAAGGLPGDEAGAAQVKQDGDETRRFGHGV